VVRLAVRRGRVRGLGMGRALRAVLRAAVRVVGRVRGWVFRLLVVLRRLLLLVVGRFLFNLFNAF